METFEISTLDDVGTLTVAGEVSIMNSTEFKTALLTLYDRGTAAVVNMEGLTGADLTCLQLLCSAHRTFMRSRRSFDLIGCFSDACKIS